MHCLWLVTLLTTPIILLLHTPSIDTAPILTSPLNITGDDNVTTKTTRTAVTELSKGGNLTTLASEYPKVQNDPRLLAKALDLKDWFKVEPTPIGAAVIATSAIIPDTTTKIATIPSTTIASTTVSTTVVPTTTVPTTTVSTATVPTTTVPSTTVPTTTVLTTTVPTTTITTIIIPTTTTLNVVVVDVPQSTDLIPFGPPDDEESIVFNNQESLDLDTQIATGGSEESDAPKIHEIEVTPQPDPVELILPGEFRNTDDEDYAAESSATQYPESFIHESSASTPPANRNLLQGAEIDDYAYHLPNTNETDDFVDKPYNGDVYPLTLSDQVNIFMHEFGENHPGVAYVLVCTLFAVIVMLLFLAVRECCKSRFRKRSRTPPSVTADLYNTSACSHFYQKPTLLPNQQEVTMQLVSSDIAEDMV